MIKHLKKLLKRFTLNFVNNKIMKKNLSWKKEENGNKMRIFFIGDWCAVSVKNKWGLDHHVIDNNNITNMHYLLAELVNIVNCYNITFGSYKTDKEFRKFIVLLFNSLYGGSLIEDNTELIDGLFEDFPPGCMILNF